jgi:3-phenylpropionate/trans-cinnamate dioxygenase ferredoxin component
VTGSSVSGQRLLVGPADSLPVGEARKICVPGSGPIAVFHSDDGFHALDDTCSHGQASLSEGWLEGHEIECPVHSGRFDIRTGAPLCFPVTEPVAAYPVDVEDGLLYVVLPEPSAA